MDIAKLHTVAVICVKRSFPRLFKQKEAKRVQIEIFPQFIICGIRFPYRYKKNLKNTQFFVVFFAFKNITHNH